MLVPLFNSTRSRRRAFTLIELLVVVAIVIVLAALVFSLTRSAISSAHRATCANKMKQIGVAIASYTNDEQRFPGEETGLNFDSLLVPYFDIATRREVQGRAPLRKRRYPELAAMEELFSCPADREKRDSNYYKRSYSIVPWATNWTNGGVNRGWPELEGNVGVHITKVTDPSRAALMVEWHIEGNLFGGGSYAYSDQGNSTHGKKAGNTLFVDGHIEAIPRTNEFVKKYWPGTIGPAN